MLFRSQLMHYHRTLPALYTRPTGIGGCRILVPGVGIEPTLAVLEAASSPRTSKHIKQTSLKTVADLLRDQI